MDHESDGKKKKSEDGNCRKGLHHLNCCLSIASAPLAQALIGREVLLN